jgi:hypothetical protein
VTCRAVRLFVGTALPWAHIVGCGNGTEAGAGRQMTCAGQKWQELSTDLTFQVAQCSEQAPAHLMARICSPYPGIMRSHTCTSLTSEVSTRRQPEQEASRERYNNRWEKQQSF